MARRGRGDVRARAPCPVSPRQEAVPARPWPGKRASAGPRAHSRRFFLVDYGIELLEKEIAERNLHVQLVAYTVFVLIFMTYLFTTVAVDHATQRPFTTRF